jgi:hypothetical protein
MVNYYHNFIPHAASILSPLYELLKGKLRPKKRKLDWKAEHQTAFERAKRAIKECTYLAFDDSTRFLVLTTDGSSTHCGAVLEIPVSDENLEDLQPLAFFSKPFTPTTRTRSTFNRELTAIYLAIKYFKHYVRGRSFIIRTDHKALVNAINNGNGEHSLHEQGMINYIKEYGPKMIHIEGEANAVADSLSRPNTPLLNCIEKTTWQIPTVEDFAMYQDEDPYILKEIEVVKASKKLKLVARQTGDHILYGVVDSENANFRPIVPKILQPAIFHSFHDTLHQGVHKSIDVVRRHYFWSNMSNEIEQWVKFCPKCQCCKITKHNRQVLENFPSNPKRFHTVHIDIVGPLHPESYEYNYLLTMRDRNTGFVRMTPLPDKSSFTVTTNFKANWVSIFGVPDKVVTDNGGEFVSSEFENACSVLGMTHIKTTPYHPQSNGFIERIHRMLKTALRALDDKEQWSDQIPLITLMLNNQVTDANSYTPYQKVFGKTCRLPGVILTNENSFDELPEDRDIELFCELMSHHSRHARPFKNDGYHVDKNLMEAKHVWVRKEGFRPSLSPIYEGPYLVTQRSNKYFTILCYEGEKKVSVDRLKVAYVLDEEETDVPDLEDSLPQTSSPLRRSKRVIKKPEQLNL